MKPLCRFFSHLIFRIRWFNNTSIKIFSREIRGKKIFELWSGKKVKGKYPYSVKQFFHGSNEFIQSDIIDEYGHKVVDVTNMEYRDEFDIVLCMNVLEHVFDYQKAIQNIFISLKPWGIAVILVPVFYPLHDEPNDFWRFTEHSLRKLLQDFSEVKIKHSWLRQYPFAYYVEAYKG
jgi:SAM-dependent methyltransferase